MRSFRTTATASKGFTRILILPRGHFFFHTFPVFIFYIHNHLFSTPVLSVRSFNPKGTHARVITLRFQSCASHLKSWGCSSGSPGSGRELRERFSKGISFCLHICFVAKRITPGGVCVELIFSQGRIFVCTFVAHRGSLLNCPLLECK